MPPKSFVILAGRKGTRLRPAVKDKPKALADINGKPFIFFILEQIKFLEITDVYICTGYRSNQIKEYVNTIKNRYNFVIHISEENSPLGTGGALLNVLKKYKIESTFVINGDTYLSLNGIEVDKYSSETNYIYLKKMSNTERYATVQFNDENMVTSYKEKELTNEAYISVGLYVFMSSTLSSFIENYNEENMSIEYDILPKMISNENLKCIHYDNKFIDIGIPKDYALFQSLEI